jgi:hypothetical protein
MWAGAGGRGGAFHTKISANPENLYFYSYWIGKGKATKIFIDILVYFCISWEKRTARPN